VGSVLRRKRTRGASAKRPERENFALGIIAIESVEDGRCSSGKNLGGGRQGKLFYQEPKVKEPRGWGTIKGTGCRLNSLEGAEQQRGPGGGNMECQAFLSPKRGPGQGEEGTTSQPKGEWKRSLGRVLHRIRSRRRPGGI